AAIVLAALGAGGGYWLAMHRTAAPDKKQASSPGPVAKTGEKIDPATGRKVLYWHDPMTPGQKFDKPGKSPFMDMDLVPVYADEGSVAGGITINPQTMQNLGIRIAEAR